jgi:hypothetical protein
MDVPREAAQIVRLKVIQLSHQLWQGLGRVERQRLHQGKPDVCGAARHMPRQERLHRRDARPLPQGDAHPGPACHAAGHREPAQEFLLAVDRNALDARRAAGRECVMCVPVRLETFHVLEKALDIPEVKRSISDDVVPRLHQFLLGEDWQFVQWATDEPLVKSLVEGRVSVGKLPQAGELPFLVSADLLATPPLALAERASAKDDPQNFGYGESEDGRLL